MPGTHVKVSGAWKAVNKQWVNVGGTWKQVAKTWVNVSGVWKPVYTAVEFSFIGSAYNAANQTSYTYSGVSLGAASASRRIIVGVVAGDNGDFDLSSVTVGGFAASAMGYRKFDSGGLWQVCALYVIDWPSGTTADVVVTANTGISYTDIAIYRAIMPSASPGSVNSGTATGTTDASSTVVVPAGGFAIGVYGHWGSTNAVTWTGLTEVADVTAEGSARSSHAAQLFTAAQASLGVSVAASGSNNKTLLLASWG